MKKILIIRFSAIGDVALWVPVAKRALALNSNIEITILTKQHCAFMFENTERLKVIGVDLQNKYKGILGILKLAKFINNNFIFDTVIDGHDVLRSKILLKIINGRQKITFDKGRREKQLLIDGKINNALPHTAERYATSLAKAGLQIDTNFTFPAIAITKNDASVASEFIGTINKKIIIGIAPFAQHKGKIFPISKMTELIEQLISNGNAIVLFGAGKAELEVMVNWQTKFSNIYICNNLTFAQQISVMQYCKFILSMDSANMHIAAMQGVKVFSIWGATHTSLGFAPLHQQIENCIQISQLELPCRPCSVFGNKPCLLKDTPYACLQNIKIETILNKINSD